MSRRSSVHLAWLVETSQVVAVKRLHPLHVDDELALARVRAEARRASRVEHPNVVKTLGVVRQPGEVLAAMEYIPGASLAEIAAEAAQGGLEPAVARAIVVGVLRGLHAAHQARSGFVPQTVSARRVLVGEDGRARVLGFEVPGPKAAVAIVDELPYAAPEQLARRRVDARRDVYAASVVLWETLTGRRLFPGATVEEMVRRILTDSVPPPSRLAPRIDRGLDAIVLRGLALDPDGRFDSACAMADALEQGGCASEGDVARALATLDLACIRRRRALVEEVRRREAEVAHRVQHDHSKQ